MNKFWKIVGLAILAGAVAVGGAAVAFAQTPTPTPPGDGEGPGRHGPRGGFGLLEQYKSIFEGAMADALGVTVDELQAAHEAGTVKDLIEAAGVDKETLRAAMEAAREEAVNQALADGVITQEQADALLSGKGPKRRGGPKHGAPLPEEIREAYHAAVQGALADALGLTVEELQAAREEGQSFKDLAEAAGVDVETVKAAVDAARTEVVNQAVADGVITQEQADALLSRKGPGGCQGRPNGGPGNFERPGGFNGPNFEGQGFQGRGLRFGFQAP